MDYILDKYVSPCVFMMLGFSSLQLPILEGISLEEDSVLIGCVGQSIERERL